jgi:hypothetical protein
MANIIEMHCADCGFRTNELRFGSFFNDMRILGPALDTTRNEIILADYDQSSTSQSVIPYSDTRLHQNPQNKKVPFMEFDRYKLMAFNNFCPTCHGFTLSIQLKGFID